MNVIVTGASGFTGRNLIRYLLALPGDVPNIQGLSRSAPQISHPRYTHIEADLGQINRIRHILKNISPDAIIHLAGRNNGTLTELLHSNVINTRNLLEAVLQNGLNPRILVIGSSAEYGYAGLEPIAETAPLRPVGAYGVSKVAQDLLSISYHYAHALNIAVARPFNIIGPVQADSFICGRLVRQTMEIQAGTREAIELNGGDTRRDFIDVRDVADAYWKLISHDNFHSQITGHAFNIGSGKSTSILEVIRELSAITGITVPIIMNQSKGKELVPEQISDITLMHSRTGWVPSISLNHSLKNMMEQTLK